LPALAERRVSTPGICLPILSDLVNPPHPLRHKDLEPGNPPGLNKDIFSISLRWCMPAHTRRMKKGMHMTHPQFSPKKCR